MENTHKYEIELRSLEDSTTFEIELTNREYRVLKRVEYLSKEAAYCSPVLIVTSKEG